MRVRVPPRPSWQQIADEQRRAAQILLQRKDGCPRAACSRAYYAAYALIADFAPPSMALHYGLNPGHGQVQNIVDGIRGIPKAQVKLALRRLRISRVSADYGVGQNVSRAEAKERLRDCAYVFRELVGK